VPDVRPYLRHARVVVAPLRIARGIQNKVLEAMAMGRSVVVAKGCGEAVDAVPERDLLLAESAEDHVRQVMVLLETPERRASMGVAARRQVVQRYSWDAHLSIIDRHVDAVSASS
jgi:glycosyltransferase involved in cell wall biosynthesis